MPRPRSRNTSRHTRLRQNQAVAARNRLGYMLGGGSVAGILVMAIGLAAFRSAPVDDTTGCPIERRTPPAHTLILIDETDSLNRDELQYARALIKTEYLWLPMGGKLTVRNIVSDPDEAEDIVVCRMEDGSGVLGIAANKKMVTRKFDQVAGARLNELFDTLAEAPPQRYSPILEFVYRAVDRPDFGASVEGRRLVVLSDLAQHSDLASHYGRRARFALNENARSQAWRDMTGLEVRLHYISRPKLSQLQGARHKAFWTNYFEGMGAKVALGHDLLIGEVRKREIWTDA